MDSLAPPLLPPPGHAKAAAPPSKGPPAPLPPPKGPPPAATKATGASMPVRHTALQRSAPGEVWALDPQSCTPLSLGAVDRKFADAVGFSCSDSGSDGVLFVGWPDGGVVVLKASPTILADAFAHELGVLCKMPFPNIKLAWYTLGTMWEDIYTAITKLNVKRKERDQGGPRKFLERVIFTVMEFVPGKDLYHINPQELFGPPGTLSPQGRDILFGMGRIIMFDVWVNNWDRFPLKGVWTHEGNFANFIFAHAPGRPASIVGIDQSVQCVNPTLHRAAFDKYRGRVEALLQELAARRRPGQAAPILGSVREGLLAACGHDIGPEGTDLVAQGMVAGLADVVRNVTPAHLREIHARLDGMATALIGNMSWGADVQFRYGMLSCNAEGLENLLELFARYLPQCAPTP